MPRSQPVLAPGHPLENYKTDADCVAEVPEQLLNDLVMYYDGEEPPGEPVSEGEELV